jgi:hypothetical protein
MVTRFSGLGAMGNSNVEIPCALLGAKPAAARVGTERRRSANEADGWSGASVRIVARVSGPPAAPAS